MRGTVTGVRRVVAGSATVSAVSAGDTQIPVWSAGDFGDDGTAIALGTEIVYTEVLRADDYSSGVTQDTLVVDSCPIDIPANIRVDVRPEVVTYRATVLMSGSLTPVDAVIEHGLIDAGALPVQSGGLSVPVRLSDGDPLTVVDVVGTELQRDARHIQPSTLASAAVDQADWTAQRLTAGLINALQTHADIQMVGPDIRSSTDDTAVRIDGTGMSFADLISLPDVADPIAVITAVIRALGLDISGVATVREIIQILAGGSIDLATAAPNPSTAPNVSIGWPQTDFPDLVREGSWSPIGLVRNAADDGCLTLATQTGDPGYSIFELADDGTVTKGAYVDGDDVDMMRGLTRIGTSTWIIYVDYSGQLKAQEWPDAGGSGTPMVLPIGGSPYFATLGTDGTHLLVAWCDNTPAPVVTTFSTAGLSLANVVLPAIPGADVARDLEGVQRGNFDWGEPAWVIWVGLSPTNRVLVAKDSDTSGWHFDSDFPPAPSPLGILGACWDGTAFRSLSYAGHAVTSLYGDSSLDGDAQPFYPCYTWFQTTGGYESAMSPAAPIRWLRRSQLYVSAGDSFPGSFGSGDPDSIRCYTGDAGTPPNRTQMHLLGASVSGSASFIAVTYDDSAANPPASNDFPGSDDPPGKVTLGGVDALVPDGPVPATWSGDVIDFVQGLIDAGGGGTAWGAITGTLSDQTDLNSALSGKQPLDSDLTTIAGLTATTDNFMVAVSSAWASRTPSQVRTTLGLVIGTNVQAWDADLDTWATKTPPSGAAVGTTDTQTLTNKRITKRVGSGSSGIVTVNTDNYDVVNFASLSAAISSLTLSGTPTDGQELLLRFTDSGTARAIATPSNVAASGVAVWPTTTVVGKVITAKLVYDGQFASKWIVLAADSTGY